MRSRVAVATAVSRGASVVVGVFALVGAELLFGSTGTAAAATRPTEALTVVRDSVDAGLAGTVGLIAVLVGAAGLVFGLTRHRRQSVAKRTAERAVAAVAAADRRSPAAPTGTPVDV
jgi:hypothetical protein